MSLYVKKGSLDIQSLILVYNFASAVILFMFLKNTPTEALKILLRE